MIILKDVYLYQELKFFHQYIQINLEMVIKISLDEKKEEIFADILKLPWIEVILFQLSIMDAS